MQSVDETLDWPGKPLEIIYPLPTVTKLLLQKYSSLLVILTPEVSQGSQFLVKKHSSTVSNWAHMLCITPDNLKSPKPRPVWYLRELRPEQHGFKGPDLRKESYLETWQEPEPKHDNPPRGLTHWHLRYVVWRGWNYEAGTRPARNQKDKAGLSWLDDRLSESR